jgi:hypothetical protein
MNNEKRRLLNERKPCIIGIVERQIIGQKSVMRRRKCLRSDWRKDPLNLHGINPWPLFKQLVHGQSLLTTREPTQIVVFNLFKHIIWKEVIDRKDQRNDSICPRHRQQSSKHGLMARIR